VFIARGEIDVLDGAFPVVEVTGIRTRIPLDRYRLRPRPPRR